MIFYDYFHYYYCCCHRYCRCRHCISIFLFAFANIVNINYDHLIIKEKLRDCNRYKSFYCFIIIEYVLILEVLTKENQIIIIEEAI